MSKSHKKSKFWRDSKYPDGYLEDCSKGVCQGKIKDDKETKEIKDNKKKEKISYMGVSLILATATNQMLSKANNYLISFSEGVLEGNGISMNQKGDTITFENEGSYRFEIDGEAVSYSDTEVKLVYRGLGSELAAFSTLTVKKEDNKLKLYSLATILPLSKNQEIKVSLVSTPDENLVLLAKTRLMIYRVA